MEYADVHLALVQAATKFSGPDVRAALLPEVGIGASVQRRIAQFGAAAIDGLLQVYAEPKGSARASSIRFGALKTLAAIILGTNLSTED